MNAFEAIENKAEYHRFKVWGEEWRCLAKKVHLINTPVKNNNNANGHCFYVEGGDGKKHKVNIQMRMADGKTYYTKEYGSGILNGVGLVFVNEGRVWCVLKKARFDRKGVKI